MCSFPADGLTFQSIMQSSFYKFASLEWCWLLEAFCSQTVCAYVRASVFIYGKFVNTTPYKPLVQISPNLQLCCSWDRDELIQLWDQGHSNTTFTFRWRHDDRWFSVDDYLVLEYQALSQDFTFTQKLRGCIFFLKEMLTTFFIFLVVASKLAAGSIFLACLRPTEHFNTSDNTENSGTVLIYWTKQALYPNRSSFFL